MRAGERTAKLLTRLRLRCNRTESKTLVFWVAARVAPDACFNQEPFLNSPVASGNNSIKSLAYCFQKGGAQRDGPHIRRTKLKQKCGVTPRCRMAASRSAA
ncbi:hypothetical protein M3I54_11735 [Paraburkholderia sp. CNPSo 3274]|uniref:hypothetical protein n=1 Tax=Paraburkholderia sp. CNPSo 3274 TaxID=2940932 RepID=UPI0020B7A48C|nr:hypothetical protein [Paraburkholderia sp. CNPSo 3274]MCP3707649.1 hypothetical protein [Paraburkholderia sp. CNPSo 3274]